MQISFISILSLDQGLKLGNKSYAWVTDKSQRKFQKKSNRNIMRNSGRERGIRTPGGVTLNGFQDRRFQPLSHLPNFCI